MKKSDCAIKSVIFSYLKYFRSTGLNYRTGASPRLRIKLIKSNKTVDGKSPVYLSQQT